jgi:hypothetical protein
MSDQEDEDYWLNYETCPGGFCRHWDCNCDCEKECKICGISCPNHHDLDHEYEDKDEEVEL